MIEMDKLVSLCKQRGFIFQSSEIYGGFSGFWDYGPLGVELKNNVKRAWWKAVVQERDDMVGLDAAIIMNPRVWEASGHVTQFTDPMVDCKSCKKRYRADQVGIKVTLHGEHISNQSQPPAEVTPPEVAPPVRRYTNPEEFRGVPSPADSQRYQTKCPACGGELTEARQFNLLFRTFVGPVQDDASVAYLRPETAQGIFANFNNVLQSSRKKLPFGIAQIGKAFRNEITPGNFTFRSREFEQMEIEYFVKPEQAEELHQQWIADRLNWYVNLGIKRENLRPYVYQKDELAHYAAACTDIEFLFPMGWSELEGIANRTDFDLKNHTQASGENLVYFDPETNQHITPYVIEPSAGVDRSVLAFLIDADHEEKVRNDKRKVMRLHKELAPVKAAVFPLLANRPEIVEVAKKLAAELRSCFPTAYDDTASIGRLYRRQDEIGTLYCITVDVQSLDDKQVTIRDRDTMKQIRVPIERVKEILKEKLL
ncbi:MAG: glycine--tRNA ligase [bacterium]|nr:glycine--tRNA ligase [bacterium]